MQIPQSLQLLNESAWRALVTVLQVYNVSGVIVPLSEIQRDWRQPLLTVLTPMTSILVQNWNHREKKKRSLPWRAKDKPWPGSNQTPARQEPEIGHIIYRGCNALPVS